MEVDGSPHVAHARRPLMSILPKAAQPLLHAFAGAFTPPTFKRFFTLMLGAVLTTGRRTITNLLRAVGGLAPGHPSSYHRVFSRRRWSLWTLGHALADFILRRWVPQGSVPLVGDDTLDEHLGAKVYGKGRHRDPVRSTRSYTAYSWGHILGAAGSGTNCTRQCVGVSC